ncbi:unnamed protein product [Boreogadus saida]
MVEKELGERNFGLHSLKYMNRVMEEKGLLPAIVPRRSPATHFRDGGASAAGLRRETIADGGQKSLSPPCRCSVYFRLMWKRPMPIMLPTTPSRRFSAIQDIGINNELTPGIETFSDIPR